MKKWWVIICCMVWQSLYAVETIIVGDILDESTGQSIAGANIYFQHTQIGTTSNAEGSFALRVDMEVKHTLVISAIGYQQQRYTIEPGQMAGMEIRLKEKTNLLNDVWVIPGENPALALVAAVRLHRTENDRQLFGVPEEMIEQTQLSVSHITSRQLKRSFWRGMQSGMLEIDSTYQMPLYKRVQQVELTGNQYHVGKVWQEEALLLTASDYSALLELDGNISFYQSHIYIMGQTFLSPLAASGTTYYKYYLADSMRVNDSKWYVIHYKPRNPFYATFKGEMWVDSATLGVRKIYAELPSETTINYLKGVRIEQHLQSDNTLSDVCMDLLLDFAVTIDTTQRVLPTACIHYTLQRKDTISVHIPDNQLVVDSMLSDKFTQTMDSLRDMPAIRVGTWLGKIITTGYIPTGTWIDIGHVQEILQVNAHETLHLGLSFRTNERLMRNVCLEANVGYGIRDKAWKGMGKVQVNLPTLRRNILSVSYHDHYVWTEVDDFVRLKHENSVGYGTMDFTSYAFEALHRAGEVHNTAARQRQIALETENDLSDHVETHFFARLGWQGYGDPLAGYNCQPTYSYQTIGGIIRIGFDERKVDSYFRRVHVYGALPIIYIGIEGGSYSDVGSPCYQLYSHLRLMVREHIPLGMAGQLEYALQAGLILGHVPYPLLHHFEGNQGYGYDPYRFTLMNNFQYASDRYLSLQMHWNGRGILFNLIPGIRYLGWRELVSFQMAWGGLNDAYSGLQSLATPYIEIGCGIGNILRIVDIHSIWRLTHRDDTTAPLWAIRFRLNLDF